MFLIERILNEIVLINRYSVSLVSPFILVFGQEGRKWSKLMQTHFFIQWHSPGNLEHVWGLSAPNSLSSVRICKRLCSGSSHFSYCPHSPYIFISQLLDLFITWKHPSCGHHRGAFLSVLLLTDKISQNIFYTHCTLSPFFNKFCPFVLCDIVHDKHRLGGRATAASCFLIRYC